MQGIDFREYGDVKLENILTYKTFEWR